MSQNNVRILLSTPQGKSVSNKQSRIQKAQSQQSPTESASTPVSSDGVKRHLRCPLCWDNPEMRGRAARRKWHRQVSGPLQKRCYVCNQCGTEWVVDVRVEEDDGSVFTSTTIAEIRQQVVNAAGIE